MVEHRGGQEPPPGVTTTTTHYAGWLLFCSLKWLLPQVNFSRLIYCWDIYYSFILFQSEVTLFRWLCTVSGSNWVLLLMNGQDCSGWAELGSQNPLSHKPRVWTQCSQNSCSATRLSPCEVWGTVQFLDLKHKKISKQQKIRPHSVTQFVENKGLLLIMINITTASHSPIWHISKLNCFQGIGKNVVFKV